MAVEPIVVLDVIPFFRDISRSITGTATQARPLCPVEYRLHFDVSRTAKPGGHRGDIDGA